MQPTALGARSSQPGRRSYSSIICQASLPAANRLLLKSYYIINTDNLDSVSELLEKKFVDVIGIDEGQFFENIDVYCDLWANFHNKKIIIAALNGDYKRKMFENITELLPKCENITKLTSICKCGEEASFTHRKNKEQKQEIIGGKDIYEPLCRICFFKFNFNIDK